MPTQISGPPQSATENVDNSETAVVNSAAADSKPEGETNAAEAQNTQLAPAAQKSKNPLKSLKSQKSIKALGQMMNGWHVSHAPTVRDLPATMMLRTFLLLIMNSIALVGYIMTFSAMGYGIEVFDTLSDYKSEYFYCLSGCFVLFVTLYLLDFSYWPSTPVMKTVKYICVGIILAGLVVGNVLSASDYAQAPVGLFFLLVPGYVYFIKRFLFTSVSVPNFLENMRDSLTICSIAMVAIWISWFSSNDKFWDYNTKIEYTLAIDSCQMPAGFLGFQQANSRKMSQVWDSADVDQVAKYNCTGKCCEEGMMCETEARKHEAKHKWCMAGFLVWISPMIIAVVHPTLLWHTTN